MIQYMDDELFHYGIKGMKWGVRRYQNKDGSLTPTGKSRILKDSRKLANVSTKYYDAVNKRNALYDIGGVVDSDMERLIRDNKKTTQKLINKLEKKYGSVSVVPVFEKNGYVVERVDAAITKLDNRGRIRSISESSNPVATYNNWREEDAPRLKKEKAIISRYDKKISSAKSQDEKERLKFELMDELDKL